MPPVAVPQRKGAGALRTGPSTLCRALALLVATPPATGAESAEAEQDKE